jgi:hypothetical protein
VLFVKRFAETYEDIESILISCRFTGLSGRRLTSVTSNRMGFGDDTSSTNEIVLSTQASPQQIQDNLAEILHPLLAPLYERFNFFRLSFALVEEELTRMRGGRF